MFRSLLTVCLVFVAAPCVAQDIDVLLSNAGGVVDVAQYDRDRGVVDQSPVFTSRLDEFHVDTNPGFAAFGGSSGLAAGSRVEWDLLPMTYNGMTSNLLYWDGQGDVTFGAPPDPDYSLYVIGRDNESSVARGEDVIVPGKTVGFVNSAGGMHVHGAFLADDDLDPNNFSPPADGFYLIALRMRIEGLQRSDPFYISFGTENSSALTQGQVVTPWVAERVETLILPGDHNHDGVVDAADYTVWRDGSGVTHSQIDLDQWRANYGATAETVLATAVPEPAAFLTGLAVLGAASTRRRS